MMVENKSSPAFSVIIPTFNRAHLLPRAIRSVLDQSYPDFELIVVDDGSTDDTGQVVAAIEDSRMTYHYQESRGAAEARNKGVSRAKGRYVTFLDDDDEAAPDWLAEIAHAFQARQPAVTCCGVIQTYHRNGQTTEKVVLPHDLGPMVDHQLGLFITGGSFALRREVFDAVGGYASDLRAGQHTELSFRLIPYCQSKGLGVHCIMQPLVRRHIHSGASIRKDPNALLQGSLYYLEHHTDRLRRDPRKYADHWAVAGVASMRLGQFDSARKYLKRAIRANPRNWRNYLRLFLARVPYLARLVLAEAGD
jgi:glycosyltransferase involved in cell wall biosynthesis